MRKLDTNQKKAKLVRNIKKKNLKIYIWMKEC